MRSSVGKILTNKKLTLGATVGVVMNSYGAIQDYKEGRLQGRSKFSSGLGAAGNAVMFEAIGMKGMLGLGALKYGPSAITSGVLAGQQMARSMDRSARNVPFSNATFNDTKMAYTMRQAGMQLAEASKYNLQQSLMGNEANTMHRL